MKITKEGWAVVDGDTHIGKWVEETGDIAHGMKLVDEWKHLVPLAGFAIDVGANIGDTTIPLATLVGPQGMVLAFEPLPEAHECLLHNLNHAGIGPWAFAINKALGKEKGELFLSKVDNVGASCISPDNVGTKVPVITLDDYRFTRLSFMKIDVEGFELDVLEGASRTIDECRPHMVIEVSDHCQRYGRTKKDTLSWLVKRGYILSWLFNEVAVKPQVDIIAIHKTKMNGDLWTHILS